VIEIGRAAYRTLFQRTYRGRTTLFCSLWVLQTFGLYGFSAWVPTLLLKEGVSLVHTLTYSTIMTIASPIGAFLAMQLPGRIERKWFVVFAAALIAIFGVIYGTSLTPAVILVFGFLVSCMLQFFAVVIYTYTPEHFPTSIRSSGMGFTYGTGRLANVLGPFLISWIYTGFGYKSVFGYITGCWIAIALIAAFLGPRSFDVPSPVGGKIAAATN
jgi:putative MFS transporter